MNAQVIGARQPGVRLDRETVGKAVEIWDGVWLLATRHHPGLSKHMFEINNRCLVFRLQDPKHGPVLLVVNAVDPLTGIPEVRRLEQETGLTVRYIVSPGGGHHLLMAPWHAQFPQAEVLLCPVRIPRTANGQKLMKLPRVRTMDLRHPLPQFAGQLDVMLFTGLVGPADDPTPHEVGTPDTKFGLFVRMARFMTAGLKDPVDELWLHHPPSGLVVAGENLEWQYRKDQLRGQPFMLRSMIKPDRVFIWNAARRVGDPAAVASAWRQILAWPGRTLMTYHDPAGHAFVGDTRAALEAAARQAKQI